jgi:hypothetical protein
MALPLPCLVYPARPQTGGHLNSSQGLESGLRLGQGQRGTIEMDSSNHVLLLKSIQSISIIARHDERGQVNWRPIVFHLQVSFLRRVRATSPLPTPV